MQETIERNTKNIKVKPSTLAKVQKLGNVGMNTGDVVDMCADYWIEHHKEQES